MLRLACVATLAVGTVVATSAGATGPLDSGASAHVVVAMSSASQGGTTFDPSTGTITVIVDLIGAEDANGNEVKFPNPADGKMETAKQAWQQGVNDLWNGLLHNGGFGRFQYRVKCKDGRPSNGFPFHLNFVINPLPPGAKGSPGHHHVTFVNQHLTGNFTDYTQWSAAGPNATTDNPSPYTHDDTGRWGIEGPQIIAHEVGHLLGLGDDDRRNQNNQTTGPVDHRATNTIMYNGRIGNKVNQNLVNRIGNLIAMHDAIPRSCGEVFRYDIFIDGYAKLHQTSTDSNPRFAGTVDLELSWSGQFNPVDVKVPRYGFVTIPELPVGVVHPFLRFADTIPLYGGPCNGTVDYPEYRWTLTTLDIAQMDATDGGAFNDLTRAVEGTACQSQGYPAGPPYSIPGRFPDQFTGPYGLTWRPFIGLLSVGFAPRGAITRSFPFTRLLKGKSVDVSSGLYSNSGSCGSACTFNAETRMTVSFTRTR
jgi:hypothetical protein